MLKFRKKILLADVIISIIFLGIVFSLMNYTIEKAREHNGFIKAGRLIQILKNEPNEPKMIKKMEESDAFANATLLDKQGKISFPLTDRKARPTVEGVGSVFTIEEPYFVSEFEFRNKSYLLKIIEPISEVMGMSRQLEFLFLGLLVLLLIFHILVSQILLGKFSQSVKQVIGGVVLYREGKSGFPARIEHEVVEDPDLPSL